jgi:uncharacterized protein YciW
MSENIIASSQPQRKAAVAAYQMTRTTQPQAARRTALPAINQNGEDERDVVILSPELSNSRGAFSLNQLVDDIINSMIAQKERIIASISQSINPTRDERRTEEREFEQRLRDKAQELSRGIQQFVARLSNMSFSSPAEAAQALSSILGAVNEMISQISASLASMSQTPSASASQQISSALTELRHTLQQINSACHQMQDQIDAA